jgi:hypothetical protein
MERFKIITLIDITRTRAPRTETDIKKIKQQANFNSFLQTINMRSNIDWHRDPAKNTGSLPYPLEGKANHWIWEFETERDEIYLKNHNPVGHLLDDLDGVPIIADLENTVDLSPSVIKTKGPDANTWVQII